MDNINNFYKTIINHRTFSLEALINDLEKFIEVPFWDDIYFDPKKKEQHNYLKQILNSLYDLQPQETTNSSDFRNSFVSNISYLTQYQRLNETLTQIIEDYDNSYEPVYKDFPSITSFLACVRSLIQSFNDHGNNINPIGKNQPPTASITDPNDPRNLY